MKLCEECDNLLIDGQRVICDNPECFRVRRNRRSREYRRQRIKKQKRRDARVIAAIKRIPTTFEFQHASPERAIKIFDKLVGDDIEE